MTNKLLSALLILLALAFAWVIWSEESTESSGLGARVADSAGQTSGARSRSSDVSFRGTNGSSSRSHRWSNQSRSLSTVLEDEGLYDRGEVLSEEELKEVHEEVIQLTQSLVEQGGAEAVKEALRDPSSQLMILRNKQIQAFEQNSHQTKNHDS